MNTPINPDPTRDRTGSSTPDFGNYFSSRPTGRPTGAVATTSDERTWAIMAHLSTLAAALLSVGWASILGPLAVWAVKKDKSPFVRESAARAFNFNLVIWAMMIFGWICFFTLIGIPVAIVVWVVAVIASVKHHIKAARAASDGVVYDYPWSIKVLS